MRLHNYLNEEAAWQKADIKPFLKEFKDSYLSYRFIYRGHGSKTKTYAAKTTRKDRKPRLVSSSLHEYLSSLSKKFWGWDARKEGVFTGCYNVADAYGTPNVFVPIGQFKYIWIVDTSDLYGLYDYLSEPSPTDFKEGYEFEKKELEELYRDEYSNKGLDKFIMSDRQWLAWEAIFKCDNYFLFNKAYFLDNIKEIYKYHAIK